MTTDSPVSVNKRLVLVITTVTSFILPFLIVSVNVALPAMARDLGMKAVVMSWVGTVYFLAAVMVQVPFGRLSDIYGRRKLFLIGLAITTAASFLGGFANSVPLLIVSRAFQGFGAGMTANNSIAILSSVYPGPERGKALGISMMGIYAGISLGPFIGGILTEYFGWQSIFHVSGVLNIMLVIMVFLALKAEWREARGGKFDLEGSIIFSISIAMFMYGFSAINTVLGIGLFTAGAAGLLFFVRWESRVPSPVFQFSLFRENRVFLFSNLATLITYLSAFAVIFLLSLYLQYIKGFSPQTTGLVLLASSVLITIFTPLSGRISDKIEPRLVAAAGMVLNCAALFMFIFLGTDTAIWYIITALAVYGIGIGLFAPPNTNAIMGAVDNRMLSVASGTLGTMRTAGMMLSIGIMMILFSLYIGDAEITAEYFPEFLASARMGFIIFTVLGIGGLVAQMFATAPTQE